VRLLRRYVTLRYALTVLAVDRRRRCAQQSPRRESPRCLLDSANLARTRRFRPRLARTRAFVDSLGGSIGRERYRAARVPRSRAVPVRHRHVTRQQPWTEAGGSRTQEVDKVFIGVDTSCSLLADDDDDDESPEIQRH